MITQLELNTVNNPFNANITPLKAYVDNPTNVEERMFGKDIEKAAVYNFYSCSLAEIKSEIVKELERAKECLKTYKRGRGYGTKNSKYYFLLVANKNLTALGIAYEKMTTDKPFIFSRAAIQHIGMPRLPNFPKSTIIFKTRIEKYELTKRDFVEKAKIYRSHWWENKRFYFDAEWDSEKNEWHNSELDALVKTEKEKLDALVKKYKAEGGAKNEYDLRMARKNYLTFFIAQRTKRPLFRYWKQARRENYGNEQRRLSDKRQTLSRDNWETMIYGRDITIDEVKVGDKLYKYACYSEDE